MYSQPQPLQKLQRGNPDMRIKLVNIAGNNKADIKYWERLHLLKIIIVVKEIKNLPVNFSLAGYLFLYSGFKIKKSFHENIHLND